MKLLFLSSCTVAVLALAACSEASRQENGVAEPHTLETTKVRIPSKEERLRMSPSERITLLEELGYVPDNPEMSDYYYAEKTSWWGKRLDPVAFWTNRVLWLDSSAEFEANRRGRAYPPMPYDDPWVADRSDVDKGGDDDNTSLDSGWQPGGEFSEREKGFWWNFQRTHPHPPEKIERWLGSASDHSFALRAESKFFHPLGDVKALGYPIECVNAEAFYWDHVMRKRAEYDELVASGYAEIPWRVEHLFDRVHVDRALITEPLTDEQIDAANAWKVQYLNRLRNEKWDESYINAYLEAWDLTEEYVFGEKEVE